MAIQEPPSGDSIDVIGDVWTLRAKIVVSLLLSVHLFAVFAAPCASPPPSSDLWQEIAGQTDRGDGLFLPYLRLGYLNHGYRFFAPNPGPSHLVRYEIDLKTGGTIKGEFPDPDEHFPRLLYHRMFMLSETAFNLASPVLTPAEPGTLTREEQLAFDKQLAASDELANSIARRLLDLNAGQRIRLYLQTHELPFPSDVAAGQSLDDPSLYSEQFWCEISDEQLRSNRSREFAQVALAGAQP